MNSAKVPIESGQLWTHANGERVNVLGTGLMKVGNPGENKENWIASVVYRIGAEPVFFTRDEITFRQRFTYLQEN